MFLSQPVLLGPPKCGLQVFAPAISTGATEFAQRLPLGLPPVSVRAFDRQPGGQVYLSSQPPLTAAERQSTNGEMAQHVCSNSILTTANVIARFHRAVRISLM